MVRRRQGRGGRERGPARLRAAVGLGREAAGCGPLPFPVPRKDPRLWETSSLPPGSHEEINQGKPLGERASLYLLSCSCYPSQACLAAELPVSREASDAVTTNSWPGGFTVIDTISLIPPDYGIRKRGKHPQGEGI